jgi:glycosyltransferase involved in cell wall biosynthesis
LLEALPNDALPALYGGALALVTPSHYEGFGLPALEAMACGTVPIVSDRASLPEVTGDVGLKIDPDRDDSITEALRRAWQDDAWRAQESARALARAAQFTWVHTARIVLDTYQAVCSCTC